MMGLRLREGVPMQRLRDEAGADNLLDQKKCDALIHEGLLIFENDTLRASQAGMQRLNGILGYLLT